MFIDKAHIFLKAGNGGNGKVSFHREKYVSAGGPDGGDGGKGGNIVFLADTNLSTLADFKYKRKFKAEDGECGKPNRCYGKSGEDLIIRVPLGTVIKDYESGKVVADISGKEPVIVASGGKGGWGNNHFATATRQIPTFAKCGMPGEELDVTLELKLLADVGLLGFPNVGKSTLISVVSGAKPIIANYHFTTITPVLGVVKVGDTSFVMADIPGLIEDASIGAGLGHQFLRHVERCRVLIHILDASGSEGRDPKEDFDKINNELEKFDKALSEKPQIVALNKCDMCDEEDLAQLHKYFEDKGYKVFDMMAAIAEGTKELINYTAEVISQLPPTEAFEVEYERPKPELGENRRSFKVHMEGEIYVVDAPWVESILERTDPDDYESLQYFQRVLEDSGIIAKLNEMGVQEGDTVRVCGLEFDYVD